MSYALAEYLECHAAEARAFNERMRAAGGDVDAGFLLPEHAPAAGTRFRQYLVTDGETVRGGCLIHLRPHWLAGGDAEVWNIQSPLSEGIIDRTHANVALFMMKSLIGQNPLIYAMGMGSETLPFPRLLKALGWKVKPVPFLFRVLRGNRFLREMPVFRQPEWRRRVAQLGAGTGLGAAGFNLFHWRPPAQGDDPEKVARYSDSVTALWQQQREQWAFASRRDAATLNSLYGSSFAGERWELSDGTGWALTTLTHFRNHRHFGNLRVGTIADVVSQADKLAPLIEKLTGHLRRAGADLIITNQMDSSYQAAFRARGFSTGPSNFLFGASKALEKAIGPGRVHLTRGDGDGLINLGGEPEPR